MTIAGFQIPCANLDNGMRVLTQGGFLTALGRASKAKGGHGATSSSMPAFLAAANLQPFCAGLMDIKDPVIFRTLSGRKAFGYRAELLPAACNVYLEARDAGVLAPSQYLIAERCNLLVRGLAVVAIFALVDAATGYEKVRERTELEKILSAYISPSLMTYQSRFPQEFYKHLFRLKGWAFDPHSLKRPKLLSRLTLDIVYERLPDGVLEALQEKNPTIRPGVRKYKLFQYLTEDTGNPHLDTQLSIVIALMRASSTWSGFKRSLDRACPNHKTQAELDLYDEDPTD
ncbi:MAG TPA: P63C domain-containing protein [Capsulimonadaceae bacterium]